jgi:hypothetical protein
MAHRGETSIQILAEQWDRFYEAVDNYSGMATKEANFVDMFLLPSDNNDLWLRTIRDCLSESMGFEDDGAHLRLSEQSISAREDFLKTALLAAKEKFLSIQEQIRSKADGHSAGEEKLLQVKLDEDESTAFSLKFVVDIGRFLGFHRKPRTQSWIYAGRSFEMAQFCQNLSNDQNGTNDAVYDPHDNDDSGYEGLAGIQDIGTQDATNNVNFKAGNVVSTFVRMCLLKTWSEYFQGPNAQGYSAGKLLSTESIQAAKENFDRESHKWNVPQKIIPLSWFPDILKTAGNWERGINAKRREDASARKPTGDCFSDWNIKSLQKEWEAYFCAIIGEAKCKAPKTSRHREKEGESKSSINRKKAKSGLLANEVHEVNEEVDPSPSESLASSKSTSSKSSVSFLDLQKVVMTEDNFAKELSDAKVVANEHKELLIQQKDQLDRQLNIFFNYF